MSRRTRWLTPVILAVGALAGGGTALALEAAVPEGPSASDERRIVTPVLSVRRLPVVVAAPIAARRLRQDLAKEVARLPADSCLAVAGPDVAFAHRADAPVVPASTAKLLTATGALLALGPDRRLSTAVVAGAPPVEGVVTGDLILQGGGDPLLATADYVARFRRQPQAFTDLDALAAAVVDAGVRRVSGAVVGDDGHYDRARYVAGWPARYIDQNVVGPLSGLSVNDGFASFPTPADPDRPLEPADDPAASAAATFAGLLEGRGVAVGGPARSGSAPADAMSVAAIRSAPLGDVVAQLLGESDNNTAELLLKEVGRDRGNAHDRGWGAGPHGGVGRRWRGSG